jgi:hypothetical protein
VRAGHGIDQLRGDADTIAGPLDTTFEDVTYAQLPPDLPDVDRFTLVLKRRIASEHHELGESGQFGDDVLGDAVTEVLLLRISGEIDECQYRDRGPIGERLKLLVGIGFGLRSLGRYAIAAKLRNRGSEPLAAARDGFDDGVVAVGECVADVAHAPR